MQGQASEHQSRRKATEVGGDQESVGNKQRLTWSPRPKMGSFMGLGGSILFTIMSLELNSDPGV